MGGTLFARPPSSFFFPSPKARNPGPPPSAVTPAKRNGEILVPSKGGSSFTERAAVKWLNRLEGKSKGTVHQPCRSPLLIKHRGTGSYSEVFPQPSDGSRSILFKAAQKLSKLGRKGLKQDGHLLPFGVHEPGKFSANPPYGQQLAASESRKDSTGSIESLAHHVHDKGKGFDSRRATRADGGDDESLCRRSTGSDVPGRIPQPGSPWLPYTVGTATLTSAAAALKSVQSRSAHACVEHGQGNGHQPPPGSGDGGGGGGDSGGGFDAGSNGESFFGDLVHDPRRKQDDEKLPRSVSVRKRVLGRKSGAAVTGGEQTPRSLRPLASMSSAAGDLMDGEAPIGGIISRGPEEIDHIPKYSKSLGSNVGSYSPAKFPVDGGRESPRESMVRKYDPSHPFFAGDGSRDAEDLAYGSSAPAGSENRAEDSRGRDASPSLGRGATFDSTMHSSSGKPEQPFKNYAQGSGLNNVSKRVDNYYGHTTRRGSHEVPPEFSSIRGKITEIPGFVQEGGDRSKDRPQATDFSGWVGGLVHSMVGKRTSGRDSGSGDQSVDDDGKKALVGEVAARTLQIITDQPNETGLAKSSETGALRRLQREAFSDLLKIRERLDKLEHHSGLRRSNYSGDAVGGVKTTLKGEVNSGGAFVLLDDLTSNLSRFSLQHAGMLTGLDVRFTFETPMRENDLLITQCGVGQVSGESDSSILGGPISLQKINYLAQVNDTLSLSVSPLGAKPNDIAETVNHLQGQALTAFAGGGPALYQHCRGSAIGASLRSSSVLLSMSQFLSGWGNRAADATAGPLCLSTLAQVMVQPFEHMVVSLSAVNNLWPSPPLPSSSGFHWSEMGPLVLCKTVTRPTQPTGTFTFNDLPSSSTTSFLSQVHVPGRDSWSPDAESRAQLRSSGTAMQSVAVSGELDLGGHVSIGGWAQVERADWLEELEKKDFQWNLSLAQSTGTNVNWGLSVGRRKREDWGEDGSASPTSGPLEPASSQLQMEAFVKLKAGRGFTLQPGLVYILDKYSQTPAFMVRSSWTL